MNNLVYKTLLYVNIYGSYKLLNSPGSLAHLYLAYIPSKPCTLVARHISLTSCNITNPRGLCAHPVLISFQFPSQLNIWILCFSVFRLKSLEFITCQYP